MRGEDRRCTKSASVWVYVYAVCDGKERFHRWLSLWQNAVTVDMDAGVTEMPFLNSFP